MSINLFADDDLEIIIEYLERLGVEGLRQVHRPNQINKRAVIRYLIAEKLQDALDNPPEPEGQRHRVGQPTKQRKAPKTSDDQAPNVRKRS
jgi:hypothetical protein